jgi:hypothetical protein
MYALVDTRIEEPRLELSAAVSKMTITPQPYPATSAGLTLIPRTVPMSKPRRRTIRRSKELREAVDCPLAPAEQARVYARALHIACLILGGIDQLAKHLEVSEAALRVWVLGEEEPPLPVFLAAVEVVLLHLGQTGRAT